MSGLVPVTVLGGYLGAGKTTLINRLLTQTEPARLAIFVNDFGDINIDAALIERRDDNVVALTNGCVCCSIGDDLGKAIYELLENDTPTDQIIIEASGAADPARVAGYAHGDRRLGSPYVITLADAETVRARAKDKFVGKLVQRQVKSAHLVALTKTDLTRPADSMAVRNWVLDLSPGVPVIEAADLTDFVSRNPGVQRSATAGALPRFATFSFTSNTPVHGARLRHVLETLPEQVWRAKGFLDLTDGRRLLVQKVGARLTFDEVSRDGPAGTQLVFISPSPDVDIAGILRKLQDCCEN